MTYMTVKSIMNRSISLAPRRNDPKTYFISFVDREAMLRRRVIPGRAGASWPRFETQTMCCWAAFSWSYLEILQFVWDSALVEMSTESRYFTWYAPNLDLKTRDRTNAAVPKKCSRRITVLWFHDVYDVQIDHESINFACAKAQWS